HSNLSGLPAFLQEFIIHTIDFIGLFNRAATPTVNNPLSVKENLNKGTIAYLSPLLLIFGALVWINFLVIQPMAGVVLKTTGDISGVLAFLSNHLSDLAGGFFCAGAFSISAQYVYTGLLRLLNIFGRSDYVNSYNFKTNRSWLAVSALTTVAIFGFAELFPKVMYVLGVYTPATYPLRALGSTPDVWDFFWEVVFVSAFVIVAKYRNIISSGHSFIGWLVSDIAISGKPGRFLRLLLPDSINTKDNSFNNAKPSVDLSHSFAGAFCGVLFLTSLVAAMPSFRNYFGYKGIAALFTENWIGILAVGTLIVSPAILAYINKVKASPVAEPQAPRFADTLVQATGRIGSVAGLAAGFVRSTIPLLFSISRKPVQDAGVNRLSLTAPQESRAPPARGVIVSFSTLLNHFMGGINGYAYNDRNERENGRVGQSVQDQEAGRNQAGSRNGDVESPEHDSRRAEQLIRLYEKLSSQVKLGANFLRASPIQFKNFLNITLVFGLSVLIYQITGILGQITLTLPLITLPILLGIVVAAIIIKGGVTCAQSDSKRLGLTTSSTPQKITQPLPLPVKETATRSGSFWSKIQVLFTLVMGKLNHGKKFSARSPTTLSIVSAVPAVLSPSIESAQPTQIKSYLRAATKFIIGSFAGLFFALFVAVKPVLASQGAEPAAVQTITLAVVAGLFVLTAGVVVFKAKFGRNNYVYVSEITAASASSRLNRLLDRLLLHPVKRGLAIIIYPTYDWNNAFDNLTALGSQLSEQGYDYAAVRVSSVDELISRIKEFTAKELAAVLIIGGHGNGRILKLGDGDEDSCLSIENAVKLNAIKSRVAKNGVIILVSCLAGMGEQSENNLANKLAAIFVQVAHLFAPTVVASIPTLIFNAIGKIVDIKVLDVRLYRRLIGKNENEREEPSYRNIDKLRAVEVHYSYLYERTLLGIIWYNVYDVLHNIRMVLRRIMTSPKKAQQQKEDMLQYMASFKLPEGIMDELKTFVFAPPSPQEQEARKQATISGYDAFGKKPQPSRALDALAVAVVWSGIGLAVGLSIGFIWVTPLFIVSAWNLIKAIDIIQAFLRSSKESRAPPLSTPIAQNNNRTITLNPASSKLIIYNPLAHEQLHSNLSGLPAFLQEFIIHTIDFIGLFNRAATPTVAGRGSANDTVNDSDREGSETILGGMSTKIVKVSGAINLITTVYILINIILSLPTRLSYVGSLVKIAYPQIYHSFEAYVFSPVDCLIIGLLVFQIISLIRSKLQNNMLSNFLTSGPRKILLLGGGIIAAALVLTLTYPFHSMLHQLLHVVPALAMGEQGTVFVPQHLGGALLNQVSSIFQIDFTSPCVTAYYTYSGLYQLIALRLIPNIVATLVSIRLIRHGLKHKNSFALGIGFGLLCWPLVFSFQGQGDYALLYHYWAPTDLDLPSWFEVSLMRSIPYAPTIGVLLVGLLNWSIAFLLDRGLAFIQRFISQSHLPTVAGKRINTAAMSVIAIFGALFLNLLFAARPVLAANGAESVSTPDSLVAVLGGAIFALVIANVLLLTKLLHSPRKNIHNINGWQVGGQYYQPVTNQAIRNNGRVFTKANLKKLPVGTLILIATDNALISWAIEILRGGNVAIWMNNARGFYVASANNLCLKGVLAVRSPMVLPYFKYSINGDLLTLAGRSTGERTWIYTPGLGELIMLQPKAVSAYNFSPIGGSLFASSHSSQPSRALDALAVTVSLSIITATGLTAGFLWVIPLLIPALWNVIKAYVFVKANLHSQANPRAPP
ncbi:MAG: hypothetical protein WC574_07175, partial [Candidatus Omnitrophota bacterium]